MFLATNPADGQAVRSLPFDDDATLRAKLQLAESAFSIWRNVPLEERVERMREAARLLEADKQNLARLMVEEMGKPITPALGEIEKCAWLCRYYAGNAAAILSDEIVETEACRSYVSYQAIGAIFAVMPWNFPFWQVFRVAVPNLLAGNVILLKHAPSVPGCIVAMDDIFIRAGFHEDAFTPLYVDTDRTEDIISHPIVQGVTLTGSGGAGRAVAQLAGKYLKKSVLELGGADPFIVLADADVKAAAKDIAKSRLKNTGQSCIGAKRIIVEDAVYEEFMERLVMHFNRAVVGDPMDAATQIGPMSRAALRDELHRQVRETIDAGAVCLLGGEIPDRPGAWYPPTVLTDIPDDCPARNEELFGPVACVFRVDDEAAAIALANDTRYGLGAAIYTQDLEKGERIAREQLQAGACFVNEMVKSHPELPFGGIKESGYGRELSYWGMREFTNVKTVWIR